MKRLDHDVSYLDKYFMFVHTPCEHPGKALLKGVQRSLIKVVNCFEFLKLFFFVLMLLYFT